MATYKLMREKIQELKIIPFWCKLESEILKHPPPQTITKCANDSKQKINITIITTSIPYLLEKLLIEAKFSCIRRNYNLYVT